MQIDNIVKSEEDATEHFFFSDKVMKIGARVGTTGSTGASSGEWIMIITVAIVSDFDLAIIGESNTMSPKSGCQDTVKHIYTVLDCVT